MSSHHIVREKQEPALIIANGEACDRELLDQLLEWSPVIVVLDNAIYRVLELGIKIDVWLGDFDDDHDFDAIRESQYPIKIVHAQDQDKTDLEKAIEYLIANEFAAANIVWATGRRADHCITNITNLVRYKNQIRLVMIDDYSKIFPINSCFEKWYAEGTNISLIPVGDVHGITSTGLKYPLTNESLKLGYRTGSSNKVEKDGFVKVIVKEGDLLMMECTD